MTVSIMNGPVLQREPMHRLLSFLTTKVQKPNLGKNLSLQLWGENALFEHVETI